MDNVIVIAGPTAVGKTSVSIELAKKIDGEIISADSMQIYKYMDIGTAKPSVEERQGIRHYLMDELYPNENFSVVSFRQRALDCMEEILEKGRVPIVTGGTGLYLNALVYNIEYPDIRPDSHLRKKLKKMAKLKGNEYLHKQLEKIDPAAAERIHSNDIRRIVRALEIFKCTGKTITYYEEQSRRNPPPYRYHQYGLKMDRKKLYERINRRVDKMIIEGLLEETKGLISMGYEKCKPMQGLGYKEMLWYLKGRTTFEEAVSLIKRNTRRYAKRQITWFGRGDDIRWIEVDEYRESSFFSENIREDIASFGIFL